MAKESSASRRARVKFQLRDKKGRWIEMGRGVKWYSPRLGREVSGTVVGAKGRNAIVDITSEPAGVTGKPQQVSVKGTDIEVIANKASIGAPAPKPTKQNIPTEKAKLSPEEARKQALVNEQSKTKNRKASPAVEDEDLDGLDAAPEEDPDAADLEEIDVDEDLNEGDEAATDEDEDTSPTSVDDLEATIEELEAVVEEVASGDLSQAEIDAKLAEEVYTVYGNDGKQYDLDVKKSDGKWNYRLKDAGAGETRALIPADENDSVDAGAKLNAAMNPKKSKAKAPTAKPEPEEKPEAPVAKPKPEVEVPKATTPVPEGEQKGLFPEPKKTDRKSITATRKEFEDLPEGTKIHFADAMGENPESYQKFVEYDGKQVWAKMEDAGEEIDPDHYTEKSESQEARELLTNAEMGKSHRDRPYDKEAPNRLSEKFKADAREEVNNKRLNEPVKHDLPLIKGDNKAGPDPDAAPESEDEEEEGEEAFDDEDFETDEEIWLDAQESNRNNRKYNFNREQKEAYEDAIRAAEAEAGPEAYKDRPKWAETIKRHFDAAAEAKAGTKSGTKASKGVADMLKWRMEMRPADERGMEIDADNNVTVTDPAKAEQIFNETLGDTQGASNRLDVTGRVDVEAQDEIRALREELDIPNTQAESQQKMRDQMAEDRKPKGEVVEGLPSSVVGVLKREADLEAGKVPADRKDIGFNFDRDGNFRVTDRDKAVETIAALRDNAANNTLSRTAARDAENLSKAIDVVKGEKPETEPAKESPEAPADEAPAAPEPETTPEEAPAPTPKPKKQRAPKGQVKITDGPLAGTKVVLSSTRKGSTDPEYMKLTLTNEGDHKLKNLADLEVGDYLAKLDSVDGKHSSLGTKSSDWSSITIQGGKNRHLSSAAFFVKAKNEDGTIELGGVDPDDADRVYTIAPEQSSQMFVMADNDAYRAQIAELGLELPPRGRDERVALKKALDEAREAAAAQYAVEARAAELANMWQVNKKDWDPESDTYDRGFQWMDQETLDLLPQGSVVNWTGRSREGLWQNGLVEWSIKLSDDKWHTPVRTDEVGTNGKILYRSQAMEEPELNSHFIWSVPEAAVNPEKWEDYNGKPNQLVFGDHIRLKNGKEGVFAPRKNGRPSVQYGNKHRYLDTDDIVAVNRRENMLPTEAPTPEERFPDNSAEVAGKAKDMVHVYGSFRKRLSDDIWVPPVKPSWGRMGGHNGYWKPSPDTNWAVPKEYENNPALNNFQKVDLWDLSRKETAGTITPEEKRKLTELRDLAANGATAPTSASDDEDYSKIPDDLNEGVRVAGESAEAAPETETDAPTVDEPEDIQPVPKEMTRDELIEEVSNLYGKQVEADLTGSGDSMYTPADKARHAALDEELSSRGSSETSTEVAEEVSEAPEVDEVADESVPEEAPEAPEATPEPVEAPEPTPAPAAAPEPAAGGEEAIAREIGENFVPGSPDEMQAAKLYMAGAEYNNVLRDGNTGNDTLNQRIESLTGFIEKQKPLPAGTKIYRGGAKGIDEYKVGDEFSDPAFLSTSLNRDQSELMAGKGALMDIDASGLKGLAITSVLEHDAFKDTPDDLRPPLNPLNREGEILLPPGTKLRIDAIDTDESGRKIVRASAVPTSADKSPAAEVSEAPDDATPVDGLDEDGLTPDEAAYVEKLNKAISDGYRTGMGNIQALQERLDEMYERGAARQRGEDPDAVPEAAPEVKPVEDKEPATPEAEEEVVPEAEEVVEEAPEPTPEAPAEAEPVEVSETPAEEGPQGDASDGEEEAEGGPTDLESFEATASELFATFQDTQKTPRTPVELQDILDEEVYLLVGEDGQDYEFGLSIDDKGAWNYVLSDDDGNELARYNVVTTPPEEAGQKAFERINGSEDSEATEEAPVDPADATPKAEEEPVEEADRVEPEETPEVDPEVLPEPTPMPEVEAEEGTAPEAQTPDEVPQETPEAAPEGGATPAEPDVRPLHPVKQKAHNYPDGTQIKAARTDEVIEKTNGKWHVAGSPNKTADPKTLDTPLVVEMPKQSDEDFTPFDGNIDSLLPGDVILTENGAQAAVIGVRDGKVGVMPHGVPPNQKALAPNTRSVDPSKITGVIKFDAPAPEEEAPAATRTRTKSAGGVPVKDVNGDDTVLGDRVMTAIGQGEVIALRPAAGPNGSVYVLLDSGKKKAFRSNKFTNAANAELLESDDPATMEVGTQGTAEDGRKFLVGKGNKPIYKGDRVELSDGRMGTVAGIYAGVKSAGVTMEDGTTTRKRVSTLDAIDYTAPEQDTTAPEEVTPAEAPEVAEPAPEVAPEVETPVDAPEVGADVDEGPSEITFEYGDSEAAQFFQQWMEVAGFTHEDVTAALKKIDDGEDPKLMDAWETKGAAAFSTLLAGEGSDKELYQAARVVDKLVWDAVFYSDYRELPSDGYVRDLKESMNTVLAQFKSNHVANLTSMAAGGKGRVSDVTNYSADDVDFSGFDWATSKYNPNSAKSKDIGELDEEIMEGVNLRSGTKVRNKRTGQHGMLSAIHGTGLRDDGGVFVFESTGETQDSPYVDADWAVDDVEVADVQWAPEAGNFDHIEDVQTLEEEVASMYPDVGFDFSGLPLEYAKAAATHISRLATKYPMLRSNLTQVRAREMELGTFASASRLGAADGVDYAPSIMSLNTVGAEDATKTLRQMSDKRWLNPVPEGDELGSTITHEMGHILENLVGRVDEKDISDILKSVYPSYRPNDAAVLRNMWRGGILPRYPISEDELDVAELMAEAFADAELNATDAKPLSKLLHQYLMERLQEG